MKCSLSEFRSWKNKTITLSGMSGVGKTHLAGTLRQNDWFHYSGDYRIGTRYLNEAILDMVKEQAMRNSFIRNLLRNDWICIKNNIKISDLGPVSAFIGKLGNPELGGVALEDFQNRQSAYRQAEINAMYDLPAFISKAKKIYGYNHFINDVGGSLCELEEPKVFELINKYSILVCIQVTNTEEEEELVKRAQANPKPLYYRPDFLLTELSNYLQEKGFEYAAEMDPDDFTRWIFPRLFHARVPRYKEMARQGYSITSNQVSQVRDDQDFLQLLEQTIASDG